MIARCPIFIALILVLLVCTTPAFALEWYKAYGKGLDAIRSGDCEHGQALLLEALQQNPSTGLRVPTYGTMRMEYIPHLYLAQCAFQKGQIQQAANYLKEAESSGAASSSRAKEFADLRQKVQSRMQEAKQQQTVTKPPPVPNNPPPPVPQTETPKQEPPKPEQSFPKPATKPPEQSTFDRQSLINRTLKEASDAFSQQRYSSAREATNRVLLLDPSNAEAQHLLTQIALREQEDAKKRDKEAKIADINRALKTGDWATAENQVTALKLQYPSDPAIISISKQVEKQKGAEAQKRTEQEQQKGLEKQVLVAYYKGEYQTAIQLAKQSVEKDPDNWRLHFFLGCSYAALAMLEQDDREPRLNLAKEAFRKARSIAGTLSPPPYISPKILAIYRNS